MTTNPMQPNAAAHADPQMQHAHLAVGVIELPSSYVEPQEVKALTLNWAFTSILKDILLRTQGFDDKGAVVDALQIVGLRVGGRQFTDGDIASRRWVGSRIEKDVPVELQVSNVSTTRVAIVGEILTDPAQALPAPRAANPEIEAALERNRARERMAAQTLNAALGDYAKPGHPVGGHAAGIAPFDQSVYAPPVSAQSIHQQHPQPSAYAPYNPVPGNYAPPMHAQHAQAAPVGAQPIHGHSVSILNAGGAHVPAVTIPTAPGAQPVHGSVVTASPGVHAPAIAPSTTGAPQVSAQYDRAEDRQSRNQNGNGHQGIRPVATAHTHLAMLVELARQGAMLLTADPPSDEALARNHVAMINAVVALERAGLPGLASGQAPPNSVAVHLTHGQAERMLKAARGEFLAGTERSDLPYPLEIAMGIRA